MLTGTTPCAHNMEYSLLNVKILPFLVRILSNLPGMFLVPGWVRGIYISYIRACYPLYPGG